MDQHSDEIEVVLPPQPHVVDDGPSKRAIIKVLWDEISGGVGVWGAFKPIIAVTLALIPFLYLGQHFNRNHQRGFDWFMLQIPLSFTLILWLLLYIWSIIDAWKEASTGVSKKSPPNLVSNFN